VELSHRSAKSREVGLYEVISALGIDLGADCKYHILT